MHSSGCATRCCCRRWGAQPKLVPTVIVWAHGGNHVELEGSFDSWTQRYTMQRSGKDFTLVKLLPPGVYQVRCACAEAAGCPMSVCSVRDKREGLVWRQLGPTTRARLASAARSTSSSWTASGGTTTT